MAKTTAHQQRCKFCGCAEFNPCALRVSADGVLERVGIVEHMMDCEPCAWVTPDICSAPDCVRKGYTECCDAVDRALSAERATA